MSRQRKTCSGLSSCAVLLAMLFWAMPHAYADQYEDLLQFTCKPESYYFSMQTLTMWVPNCKTTRSCKIKDVSGQDSSLIAPKQLLKQPYECRLQNHVVTIHLVDQRHVCLTSAFNIDIRINGKSVHIFPAYGEERCFHGERHLVDLSVNGLTDCAFPSSRDDEAKPSCLYKKPYEIQQVIEMVNDDSSGKNSLLKQK